MTRQTKDAALGTTTPSESEIETREDDMTKPAVVTTADDYLFDPSVCEPVDPDWCASQGFSGRLFKRILEDESRIAYLILYRSSRGDFALNQAALGFLSAAIEAEQIAEGYVVLSERKEQKPIRQLSIREMTERLKDVSPMEGQYGDFWWVNDQLRPAGNGRFAASLY